MLRTVAAFSALMCVALARPHRAHGHHEDNMVEIVNISDEEEASCSTQCDAQFRSDFDDAFRKSYDRQFFDVPIDRSLVSSEENRRTYCELVSERTACNSECGTPSSPSAVEREVCRRGKTPSWNSSMHCLKRTISHVHIGCSKVCHSEAKTASPPELGLSRAAEEQHRHCLFTACHRICQNALIERMCPAVEVDAALTNVKSYYDAVLIEDAHFAIVEEKQIKMQLLSSFCRRVTPGLKENATIDIHEENSKIMQGLHQKIRLFVEAV